MSGDAQRERESRAVGGFAAYRIERVHVRLTVQGGDLLAKTAGLTLRQWWIIADMAETEPRTATELAQIADVDKGLLSRNLKTLAAMGYISVSKDKTDRRQQLIALTDAGWRVYRETLPIMNRRNRRLIEGVSEAEYETFLAVLDRIEDAAERGA